MYYTHNPQLTPTTIFMRTFIAIELPLEIKEALARIQERLKKSGADVKWVNPDNIHLTLKFLGDIDGTQFEKICAIMKAACQDKPAYSMKISSLGAFPKIEFPRVIWAGAEEGGKETKELAKKLDEKINKLGIPREERSFTSHITLGRVRSALRRKDLVEGLNKAAGLIASEKLEFKVEKITLFKSRLTGEGPVYEPLKEASLKTT